MANIALAYYGVSLSYAICRDTRKFFNEHAKYKSGFKFKLYVVSVYIRYMLLMSPFIFTADAIFALCPALLESPVERTCELCGDPFTTKQEEQTICWFCHDKIIKEFRNES